MSKDLIIPNNSSDQVPIFSDQVEQDKHMLSCAANQLIR